MRICYVLLSPTFGMHQYTADLANRMAAGGAEVHLVTTSRHPADRYSPAIRVHTPVETTNTGFSPEGLRVGGIGRVVGAIVGLRPDVVHLTGPHLWNLGVLAALRRAGVPAVHTLHDLDPHFGTAYGPLLYAWNRGVLALADAILVHGVRYQAQLVGKGMDAEWVTCAPLMHLFLGDTRLADAEPLARQVHYEPCVLFFGRLERYKGVDHLLTAWAMVAGEARKEGCLVLAGPGDLAKLWAGPLPPGVEVHNRLIDDEEALALFRRCGVLALPYRGATQSALIPAAYFFRKPVLAAPSGALDEYVEEGRTGWLVEPDHPPSLARCLAGALADPGRLAEMGAAGRAWYDARRATEGQILECMYARLAGKGD
jgi:glycosyltransferase involved in cell wall biosynthesis